MWAPKDSPLLPKQSHESVPGTITGPLYLTVHHCLLRRISVCSFWILDWSLWSVCMGLRHSIYICFGLLICQYLGFFLATVLVSNWRKIQCLNALFAVSANLKVIIIFFFTVTDFFVTRVIKVFILSKLKWDTARKVWN